MKIRLSVVLIGTLVAAGTACDVRVNDQGVSLDVSEGGRAEAESTETYPLVKGGRIELETDSGDVRLLRAAGGAAEVHIARKVRARTDEAAQALLKQHDVTVEATFDRVTIRSVKPTGPEASRGQVRYDYRIRVPVGALVTIRDENGAVRLDDVDGSFTIRSTNGHIEGHRVSGVLDVENVNGGVVMEMAAVTGDVRLTTVNGGVILRLPDTTNAQIEATTVNGGVQVNDSLELKVSSRERQRLVATLGSGSGHRIELRTTNGGVVLRGGAPPR